MTDETTTEFMAMECIEPERYSQLEEAIDELEDLLRRYVGAETMYKAILDKEHSEMNIQD